MVSSIPDKYISLLTDFGFKRVFGTEPNKRLLIDFLNTLLPTHHHIQDLTFKNTKQLGNLPDDLKAQINQLTLPELEALNETFLDFTELNDLVNWLAPQSPDRLSSPPSPSRP